MSDKQREHEIAIYEGDLAHYSDGYFNARPQLESGHNRKIFENGFERGYKAGQATQQPESSTDEPFGTDSAYTAAIKQGAGNNMIISAGLVIEIIDLLRSLRREIETTELIKACEELKADSLLYSDTYPNGVIVVNVSQSKWVAFKDALEAVKNKQRG